MRYCGWFMAYLHKTCMLIQTPRTVNVLPYAAEIICNMASPWKVSLPSLDKVRWNVANVWLFMGFWSHPMFVLSCHNPTPQLWFRLRLSTRHYFHSMAVSKLQAAPNSHFKPHFGPRHHSSLRNRPLIVFSLLIAHSHLWLLDSVESGLKHCL